MAYNILKGTVEFSKDTSGSIESMVNTWQAQTIDGNKVFVQTLSASAFTSDAGAIVPPAITAIASDGANRVLTSDGDNTATAQANVTIVNNALTASNFSGSGVGLTNLKSNQLTGLLSASQIHIGNGLEADGFNIRVDANQGIEVGVSGVSVDLMASSGIVFSGSNNELAIDPSNPPAITAGSQTLADADSFVVYDDSRTETRKAAAVDVYNYINAKISTPAITSYTNATDNRIITSVSSNTVNAEENFTFDGSLLNLNGESRITGSLDISGSGTTVLRLHKAEADTREIEIFSDGARQSAITLNATEQLFIENESTKDIILRTNNQNTLRVFGQNQRVGIAKEGTSANAELDVDGAAIISGSFIVSGSSTIGLNRSHVTQFDGPMSASAGMHISGTMPKLAIGSNTSTTTNSGMFTIRPDDTNNRVLMMLQRTEASDNRIVLAATGSGQVIVGGAHLGGLFNITGSTAERLISLKAGADDGLDPAFYIDGTGDSYLSGSQTFKEPEPGIYLSSSVDDGAHAKIILNNSKNILIQNHSFNKNVVFKTNDGGSLKEGLRIGGAAPEVVVNEGSDSLLDFRVESAANTHMIFSDGSANKVGINNSSPQLTFDVTGDVGVSNHIALNSSGTIDPSLYLNHAHIYSKLDGGTAEVYVRDSDGNVTKISPHTSEGEWEYFSRNTRTGKVVRVNMERMIRKLEEFTGESFMDEWYEEPTD